jgi:endonuclease/exonuclease/phosphatase family metal-dependent hydrolase
MKIATYNVWNKDIDLRQEQLIQEINDVDVIGLQEFPSVFWKELINQSKYKYREYFLYKNEEEGLAFLSKHPIKCSFFLNKHIEFENSLALNIVIEMDGIIFSITNVHLPWDSALAKEKQIVAIARYIHEQKERVQFFIKGVALYGLIPRPSGAATGGAGDLFPRICQYFKEKSSHYRRALPCGCLFYSVTSTVLKIQVYIIIY